MSVYAMFNGQDKVESKPEWEVIEFFCDKFILPDKKLVLKIYSEEIAEGLQKNIKEKSRYMGTYLQNLNDCQRIEEKVKNMVMIAYKIRCRLFHGEKNPLLEVNLGIIKMADHIVLPLLDYILN